MIPLFLGFAIANLLLLVVVFALGLFTAPGGEPTAVYPYHLAMGIAAGLVTVLAHLVVFTYFMATTKWLEAATVKAALDEQAFAEAGRRAKRGIFPVIMAAIVATMLTMFAGAGADPTLNRWWPGEVHMMVAALAIVINAGCHMIEYTRIKAQSRLIDDALRTMNAS